MTKRNYLTAGSPIPLMLWFSTEAYFYVPFELQLRKQKDKLSSEMINK